MVRFLRSLLTQSGARLGYSTGKDELLETAMALHDAAMKDEYFIKRKLAPNVDFWYVLPIIVTSFSLNADA